MNLSKAALIVWLLLPLGVFLVRWRLSPRRAVWGYAGVLYATFLGEFGRLGALSLANALGAILVVAELAAAVIEKRRPAGWSLLDTAFVALLGWVLLSVVSQGVDASFARTAVITAAVVLTSRFRPDFQESDFKNIVAALSVAGLGLAIVCHLQEYVEPDLWGLIDDSGVQLFETLSRVTGFQGNPNGVAFYLLIAHAALLIVFTNQRRASSLLLVLAADAFLLNGLLLTKSRAAFGAAALVMAVAVGRRLGLRLRSSAVVGGLVAAFLLGVPGVRNTVEAVVFADRPEFADTGRDGRWEIAQTVIRNHPLFGDATAEFDYGHVFYHNDFLQFAADFGIIAAVLFAIALGRGALAAWAGAESRGSFGSFMLLAIMASVVMSMFHGLLIGGICFWMLVGLAVNRKALRRSTTSEGEGTHPVFDSAVGAEQPTSGRGAT